MKPRILVILEAGDVYPSGFIRGLIYQDYFKRDGYEVEYINRLPASIVRLGEYPSRYLAHVMAVGGRGLISTLAHRIANLTEDTIVQKAKNYDVVYMSKVQSFSLVQKLRQKTKARVVLDFGDALWLPNRGASRFNEVLATVHAVTTDNELTAEYVRRFNANCIVIGDCPQIEWFDHRRESYQRSSRREVKLGWIGTPGTTYNLFVVWEALERLFSKHSDLHLRIVGADPQKLPPFEKVKFSLRPRYSQTEMIEEVLEMDIGLFPLQDVEASRVRGILKATVYMSGEAAVVCSPIGQNLDLIQHGVNGLFASSTEEWEQAIDRLISDSELRHQLSQKGLDTVRTSFTVEEAFANLCKVLEPQNF